MRALIFGHKGMLGRELFEVFKKAGHIVRAMDVDICDHAAVERAMGAHDVRGPNMVVFNAAAMTDVDGCSRDPIRAHRVNAIGAMNVASAAPGRLIHFSTDAVFDGVTARGEAEATSPINAYGESKRLGEQFIWSRRPDATIIRLCTMYGTHGRNYASQLWRKIGMNHDVTPDRSRTVAPTDARWVAETCLKLMENLPPLIHLAPSDTCNWGAVADRMAQRRGHALREPLSPPQYDSSRASVSALRCSVADALGLERPTWCTMLDAYMDRNTEAAT